MEGGALLPATGRVAAISGAGRGYLRDGNDADFWSFEAQSGDKLVVAAQIPGNPGNSGLQYVLYNPAGTQLASVLAENNGLLQTF
jgi:hypothetical protein